MTRTPNVIVLMIALAFLGLMSCAQRIEDTPLAWRIGQQGPIPDGYQTYTLFLNASVAYPDKSASDRLEALKRYFESFAASIGEKNLAVWVNDPGSASLSVSRGKYYVDLFSRWSRKNIEYSDGPFVIVTNAHPKRLEAASIEAGSSEPLAIVIGFNNISPDRIIEVLNLLEMRVRREELWKRPVEIRVLWISIKSWWDNTDQEFVKKVTLALLSRV